MKKTGLVYTVVFSFITAFFFVFLLSMADRLTSEKTAENARNTFYTSVLKSSGVKIKDNEAVTPIFNKYFPDYKEGDNLLNTSAYGKNVLIKLFRGSGLWGTITGVIAFSGDLKRIEGLQIISHNETPGLGGRIDEEWFKNQFNGERIGLSGIIVRKGSGSPDSDSENGEVDGITGASLTNKSIETIVNDNIELIRKEVE
jgi:Na+-transporting NADH:ubiquinone oxidoreductase subunit C